MADCGSNPILIGAEAKYGPTLAMAVPGKDIAAPWIAKRVTDWLDSLGSQTVTMKCDNEPAILAQAQEIQRLRRERSITILEHLEEDEKQSNHLAEGSVNIVKGLIRTLESSTESNLERDWPWIIEHTAQLKNRYIWVPTAELRQTGSEAEEFSVLCMSLARKSCSYLLLLPAVETLAQGSTMGSTWAADHSTARRTVEHPQE